MSPKKSILSRVAGFFRGADSQEVESTGNDSPMQLEERGGENLTLRRWESAQTTRLNQDQWCGVHSQPINVDLQADRATLVARSRYERQNNPIVGGVVDSYALDVVGKGGPTLKVESDNEEYNIAFKKVWDRVWSTLGADGMHGTDLLTRLVGQEWDNGDWLQQKVTPSEYENEPVQTRLLDIDPERLSTDPKFAGRRNVVMGIERNEFGRPLFYHIRSPKDQFVNPFFGDLSLDFKRIDGDDIIHVFVSREPGQVRGFPALSPVLQDMADLRDYDNQTMDSARAAANNGGLMWTNDATLVDNESKQATPNTVTFERQTVKKVPAGWQVTQMVSNNPTALYIDFRHERLRSLGRVKHMPLLVVLLSADDSNFSQSRIDLNVIYARGLGAEREWIERTWLSEIVDMVRLEASLAARPGALETDADFFLLPREPEGTKYTFGWEPIGNANPKDQVAVQEAQLRMGITTPEWLHAEANTSEDAALDSIRNTNKKRKDRGLDPVELGPVKKKEKPATENQNVNQSKTTNSKTKSPGRESEPV